MPALLNPFAVAAAGGANPFSTTYVEAHFTAADGTVTAGYTPETGPQWVNLNGVWTIQSNKLAPPGINEALMCWTGFGSTSYSMQFTFSSISGDPGPIVRVVNSSQYILCQMNSGGTSGIYRFNAGYTALTTLVSVSWANGDIIRVDVTPTTIVVKQNGVTVMSVTNSDFSTATQAGFRVAPAISTVRFDDVYIGN